MESISFTYEEPEKIHARSAERIKLGKYVLECSSVNTKVRTVAFY